MFQLWLDPVRVRVSGGHYKDHDFTVKKHPVGYWRPRRDAPVYRSPEGDKKNVASCPRADAEGQYSSPGFRCGFVANRGLLVDFYRAEALTEKVFEFTNDTASEEQHADNESQANSDRDPGTEAAELRLQ